MEMQTISPPSPLLSLSRANANLIWQLLIERDGGDGSGRHFSELRLNRTERTGAADVPRDVGDADDPADCRAGAHHVRHSIRDHLRDPRYTSLGRHRDGEGGVLEARGGPQIVLDPVTGTTTNNDNRYIVHASLSLYIYIYLSLHK